MVFFLYYVEGYSGIPVYRPLADHIIGFMFGYQQAIIDPDSQFFETTETTPLVLRSLEQARAHPLLRDLTWVWLHPQGQQTLQAFEHPEDNVVYVVGSDYSGTGQPPDGDATVRICAPDPDEELPSREFFATACIPLVAYDRALKVWQRRHSSTI